MAEKFTGTSEDVVLFVMGQQDRTKLWDICEHKTQRGRTLSMNNYFFAMITKIAHKLGASINEVHNEMLSSYGFPEYIDDKIVYFILPDRVNVNKLEGIHLKATSKTQTMSNGELNRVYLVMRGSHTYNTKEMSRLIDGVLSEAKELGIDTITDSEKAKMLDAWGKAYEKQTNKGV